mmetsp:Transcript_10637/g.43588  ORF Transcript_10637/g.43588 Transcript_10637/m.43588 type:complete len:509 (+) Transcript_10637:968-2494(+)
MSPQHQAGGALRSTPRRCTRAWKRWAVPRRKMKGLCRIFSNFICSRSGSRPALKSRMEATRSMSLLRQGVDAHADVVVRRLAPGRAPDDAAAIVQAGVPACLQACGGEIDVAPGVLTRLGLHHQVLDIDARVAAQGQQGLHGRVGRRCGPEPAADLPQRAAQVLHPGMVVEVLADAAGVLDVLVARQRLGHRARRGFAGIPQVDHEAQGVAALAVVEHHVQRRVRVDAAVPIGLAPDLHRREARRQCAAGQHMRGADAGLLVAVVEPGQLAGAHIDGAQRQPRVGGVDQRVVHQLVQRRREWRGVVEPQLGQRRRSVQVPGQRAARPEEAGHAADQGLPGLQARGEGIRRPGHRQTGPRHARPELAQRGDAVCRLVAGDQRRIDRADGGAHQPVRRDAASVERLGHAGLVGAQGAAALEDIDRLRRAPAGHQAACSVTPSSQGTAWKTGKASQAAACATRAGNAAAGTWSASTDWVKVQATALVMPAWPSPAAVVCSGRAANSRSSSR